MEKIIRSIRARLTTIEVEIIDTKFPAVMDYENIGILLSDIKKDVDNLSIAIKLDEQGKGNINV